MTYANLTDLIERAGEAEISQIADRDRDGEPDPDVIDAALTGADSVINGYVGAKHPTPLDPVPELVLTWAVSIARYRLHRNGAPEHVAQDYKDAIAALKDVSQGRIALDVSDGQSATLQGTTLAEHPPEVFTADKLRGW